MDVYGNGDFLTYVQNGGMGSAQVVSGDAGAIGALAMAIALAIIAAVVVAWLVLMFIGAWKTVKKLGGAGWTQIIPVYRDYEMARVAGCDHMMTVAYTVLCGVVLVGSVVSHPELQTLAGFAVLPAFVLEIMVARQVARRFGKGAGFTVGLVLLPCIFCMILGCGKAQPVDEEPMAPAAPTQPALA